MNTSPLVFMELIVGGILISKGAPMVSAAIAANPATGAAGSAGGAGPGGVGAIATGTAGKAESLAVALLGTHYNVGGHATAIDQTVAQVKALGTDCSGYVSDLMGPQGLGIWHTSYATPGIPTAPGIVPGKGSQITLWNNPNPGSSGHVWIEFDAGPIKRYFEEAGGGLGAHEMSASEAQMYLSSGQYRPLHPNGY